MAEDSFNLENNVPVDVEFLYDNVTSGVGKTGKRWYAMSTQHGKMWATNYMVRSILQAWQGKGCSMRITKLSDTAYVIDDIVQGDGAPLAMKEWDAPSKAFVAVKFDLDGLQPLEAAEVPEGAAVAPGIVTHHKPDNAVKGTNSPSYADLVNLMGACLSDAALLWVQEKLPTTGDYAGAVEKVGVSLFIDARKLGLRPASLVEKVVQADDDLEIVAGPIVDGQRTEAFIIGGDPGPQERDEADDLDLPF